jgi:Cysteine-rich secretory protein family
MSQSNRRFHAVVNHVALAAAAIMLSSTAQAAAKKRTVKPKPVAPVVDRFQATMLKTHNEERAFHGRAPLVWDAALAADAAKWAGNLATKRQFEHAFEEITKNGQGENLWMGTRGAYPLSEMVQQWIEEVELTKSGRFPNVSKTGNWVDVGHFTQIVWPQTQKLGCALKSSIEDDYLVCRYWPAGNRIGDNFTIRHRP